MGEPFRLTACSLNTWSVIINYYKLYILFHPGKQALKVHGA